MRSETTRQRDNDHEVPRQRDKRRRGNETRDNEATRQRYNEATEQRQRDKRQQGNETMSTRQRGTAQVCRSRLIVVILQSNTFNKICNI